MTEKDSRLVFGTEEWNREREKEYQKYLNIPDSHSLELTNYSRNTKHSRDDDEFEFIEKDGNGEVIAMYEAWHLMSIYPPHTPSRGYKKCNPEGVLIEEKSIN